MLREFMDASPLRFKLSDVLGGDAGCRAISLFMVDAQVTPFILDVAPYLAFAGAAGATPAGRVKT